jgi:hypothetical protein
LVRDEGFITHWERRPPLRRARVVAITRDVWDSSEDAEALVSGWPTLAAVLPYKALRSQGSQDPADRVDRQLHLGRLSALRAAAQRGLE